MSYFPESEGLQSSNETNTALHRPSWVISRRSFLAGTVATGANVLAIAMPRTVGASETKMPNDPKPETLVDSLKGVGEKNDGWFESGYLGVLSGGVNSIVSSFIREQGGSFAASPYAFSPREQDPILRKIMEASLFKKSFAWVLAPIGEEFLFRLLPKTQWANNSDKMDWSVGIPTTILFALQHNIAVTLSPFRLNIDRNHINLISFPLGAFLWDQLKTEGFYHAVLMHSAHNIGRYFTSVVRDNHSTITPRRNK
ncbi:MAG: CPBP family intramembrane metalloprotease [Patescibacteria group bacterium]|nr:CPBP family intramembrane metalloprotease [Patescibacteria group bacterium]